MFDDYTTVLYSHKDINSKIDVVIEELKRVSNWFKANNLSVNASLKNYSTPQMTTVKNHEDINDTLANKILERVEFTKFLVVLIKVWLTWKSHTDCVLKTISRNIGVKNKLKYFIYTI